MTEDAQMKIRLPQAVKEQVEASARHNRRTMNAEVIAVLEAFYAAGGVTHESGFDLPAPDSDLERRVSALEEQIAILNQRLA